MAKKMEEQLSRKEALICRGERQEDLIEGPYNREVIQQFTKLVIQPYNREAIQLYNRKNV